ncbi:unnamed protein product, partial [Didymodactylos carnosus]
DEQGAPKSPVCSPKSPLPSSQRSEARHNMISDVISSAAEISVENTSVFYNACRDNDIKLVKELLPNMTIAQINHVEPNGNTALHIATQNEHKEIIELLLNVGISRSIQNQNEQTAYSIAPNTDIKHLFERFTQELPSDETNSEFDGENRFVSKIRWIDANPHADFEATKQRNLLIKYGTNPKFHFLVNFARQYYIDEELKDIQGIDQIRYFFDKAEEEQNPVYLLKAYTAETGFYTALNRHLAAAQLEGTGPIDSNRGRAYILGIITHHPYFARFNFTGESYRGMKLDEYDLQQYVIGSRIMTKTFLSTSKDREMAEVFAFGIYANENRT